MRAPGPEDPRVAWMLARAKKAQAALRALEKAIIRAAPAPVVGLLARADALLDRTSEQARSWVDNLLAVIFTDGVRLASEAAAVPFLMTGLTRAALATITEQAFSDVAFATQYMKADARRFVQQTARSLVQLQVREGLSVPQAKKLLRDHLDEIGIQFRDKSGRRWKLDTYSEVVVRTKSAHAYNLGTITRGAEVGIDQFKVFDGVGDDVCRKANGQIVTAEWALANPVGHPNCTRAFGAVVSSA